MKTSTALSVSGLTRHQLYYKPASLLKRGRPPSDVTIRIVGKNRKAVTNTEVVRIMIKIQSDPDLRCGSKRMTYQLSLMGYVINRKKVARLMKENLLFMPRKVRPPKKYAAYRIIKPTCPLSMIEMDIKHFWTVGISRQAFVLSILDTFTREVLAHHIGYTITSKEVKALWDKVIANHFEPEGLAAEKVIVEIRNDGGPQFASKMIQKYFEENGLRQVFTHPYTPQENGHIESFHSIVASCVEPEFYDLEQLIRRMHRFYDTYNRTRAHGSIKGLPPLMFRKAFDAGLVTVKVNERNRAVIKLLKPIYEIPGILSRREHLAKSKDFTQNPTKKGGNEITSTQSEWAPVYPSPSIISCNTNVVTKKTRNSKQLNSSEN